MLSALFPIAVAMVQGSPSLDIPAAVAPQTLDFNVVRRASESDTTGVPLGTWRLEFRAVEIAGQAAIAYVSRFQTLDGQVTLDSVVVLRHGLRPVSESSHQPTKTMVLRFGGDSVVAAVTDSSGPHRTVTRSPRRFYNSTDTPLAVLSLPATAGFRTVLSEYTYEAGGLTDDTLSVQRVTESQLTARSATANAVMTWTVDRQHHAIARASRRGRSSPGIIEFTRMVRRSTDREIR